MGAEYWTGEMREGERESGADFIMKAELAAVSDTHVGDDRPYVEEGRARMDSRTLIFIFDQVIYGAGRVKSKLRIDPMTTGSAVLSTT